MEQRNNEIITSFEGIFDTTRPYMVVYQNDFVIGIKVDMADVPRHEIEDERAKCGLYFISLSDGQLIKTYKNCFLKICRKGDRRHLIISDHHFHHNFKNFTYLLFNHSQITEHKYVGICNTIDIVEI